MAPPRRRSLFRPPRRLRFHRAGWVVSVSAVALGLAAMATGNNLLFLLLGAMLGLIALSGWLSELTLRRARVERRVPRGVEAGRPAFLLYEIRNVGRRLPCFALQVGEEGDGPRGFLPSLAAGAATTVRVEHSWVRRGVYPLGEVTLSTSFPFGLFRKERDVTLPGEVVVWPRTDRPVREPRPAGDRERRSGALAAGVAGARGEYRSLRPYRPGDDPRDVHWRSTARTGEPVVRDYAREQAQALWICIDLRGGAAAGAEGEPTDARQEAALEIAAALAARAAQAERPVALETGEARVEPGAGPRQLERILDVLARAEFGRGAPPPSPPVPMSECVLVAADPSATAGAWGDVFVPSEAV